MNGQLHVKATLHMTEFPVHINQWNRWTPGLRGRYISLEKHSNFMVPKTWIMIRAAYLLVSMNKFKLLVVSGYREYANNVDI